MNDKRLVIKLDQYAGNVDEVVCCALTGSGEDRRGSEEGLKLFEDKVTPLCPRDDYGSELPVEFCLFKTEYGHMSYELDTNINSLRVGLDSYNSIDDINGMIKVWMDAYGDGELPLKITYPIRDYSTLDSYKDHTVLVTGFELVEVKEVRTEL